MRPLLQIKLPREAPGPRVTAASATVICPRRARVYTYGGWVGWGRMLRVLVKNGRGTRCPSSSGIQDLWLSCRDMLRSLTGSDQLNAKIETTRLDIY